MNDSRARLRYLDEVITMLYPPPADAHGPWGSYALLPSRFLPRRLVPRSLWLPGRRRLPQGSGTIEAHLSEVFRQPIRATTRVRPARRANRKPILEIRGGSGELLAFVKIGDSERARALVRHESATLQMLATARLEVVVAPVVLHHGLWNGLEVLALSPLPTRRGRIPRSLLDRAIDEIAALGTSLGRPFVPDVSEPAQTGTRNTPEPTPTTAPHMSEPARASTRDASEPTPTTAPHVREPTQAGDRDRFAWHGDFSPWNMAPAPDGRLLVWDWERFATGVPLGFDALHNFLQCALRRMPPPTAAEACLAQAVRTLAPFGLSSAESRETAVRYLIALADRYERDGHQPLGPASEWLNPVVDRQEVLP